MKKTAILILVIASVALIVHAQERGPVAVSPASDTGIARVGVNCPTFSWTSVEGAVGYKVAVFETNGPNILSYNEIAVISSPILRKEIQGQALSWTPSSEEKLVSGSMYVWYVQAVDGYALGIWSEGRMFMVEAEVQLVGMEDAIRESLREKGMSEEAIEEVLVDMMSGTKDVIAYGIDTKGSEIGSQDKVSIQGTEDTYNTLYGLNAGYTITNLGGTGNYNGFFGSSAGYFNSTGDSNTFIGYSAGFLNTTGYNNTFTGDLAGYHNDTGHENTFIGYGAGRSNTTGFYGTFLGNLAGYSNTIGISNTFIGGRAGYFNTAGFSNTFLGHHSGYYNTEGFRNTFVGNSAGDENTTGHDNTFIGYGAGAFNSTGNGNVFLGNEAGYQATGSNKLYIDNSDTGLPLLWGDFSSDILTVHGDLGVGTKSPASQMEVETTGENAILLLDRTDGATTGFSASGNKCAFGTLTNHPLWMVINGAFSAIFHTDGSLQMMNGAWCTAAGKWQDASSRELKENIQSLTVEEAKEALDKLDPVRFNYKADKDDESLGFIAEDVPDLVAAKDRKSMSAMDVVAVLTKVVQEQQRLAEEQQETIAELQKQIDELKSGEK